MWGRAKLEIFYERPIELAIHIDDVAGVLPAAAKIIWQVKGADRPAIRLHHL
jgi:hypothetical protein